jgi:hypothetical protein
MVASVDLTREEAASLQDILTRRSHSAGFRLTLNHLLQQWSSFVASVERGYDATIYDYANDLSSRDLLHEILTGAPPSLQGKLLPLIRSWDERFERASEPAARVLLPGKELSAWWWFRIPRGISTDLRHEFCEVREE